MQFNVDNEIHISVYSRASRTYYASNQHSIVQLECMVFCMDASGGSDATTGNRAPEETRVDALNDALIVFRCLCSGVCC